MFTVIALTVDNLIDSVINNCDERCISVKVMFLHFNTVVKFSFMFMHKIGYNAFRRLRSEYVILRHTVSIVYEYII